jgi:hypothetical protein
MLVDGWALAWPGIDMPRPWRMRYAGAKYHLTVRGNGRDQVFFGQRTTRGFWNNWTRRWQKIR